eukprot:1159680-Pelagomonas_calceolata.AAC.1
MRHTHNAGSVRNTLHTLFPFSCQLVQRLPMALALIPPAKRCAVHTALAGPQIPQREGAPFG